MPTATFTVADIADDGSTRNEGTSFNANPFTSDQDDRIFWRLTDATGLPAGATVTSALFNAGTPTSAGSGMDLGVDTRLNPSRPLNVADVNTAWSNVSATSPVSVSSADYDLTSVLTSDPSSAKTAIIVLMGSNTSSNRGWTASGVATLTVEYTAATTTTTSTTTTATPTTTTTTTSAPTPGSSSTRLDQRFRLPLAG